MDFHFPPAESFRIGVDLSFRSQRGDVGYTSMIQTRHNFPSWTTFHGLDETKCDFKNRQRHYSIPQSNRSCDKDK